jgi:hypothetical protein
VGEPRRCVCGCGREVPLTRETAHLVAIALVPELFAWDGFRSRLRAGERWPDSPITAEALDRFLDEGARHYDAALAVVHGEKPLTAIGLGADRWLRYSRRSRRKLARLAPGAILAEPAPALTAADLERLDRRHPETSWSAQTT